MQENNLTGSYTIIETGGKQYQAIPGKTVAIEKIAGEAGDVVTFDKVLLRKTATGELEIGMPYLPTPVQGTIVKQTKDRKLVVFRFKRRQKVRVRNGHRQPKTVVRFNLQPEN